MSNYSLIHLRAVLTVQQQEIANALVENQFELGVKRTQEEIATEFGLTRQTIWEYSKLPEFNAYMDYLTSTKMSGHSAMVSSQLIKLIRGTSNNGQPSVNAIKLFFELQGKLIQRQEVITHVSSAKPILTQEEITRSIEEMVDKLKE